MFPYFPQSPRTDGAGSGYRYHVLDPFRKDSICRLPEIRNLSGFFIVRGVRRKLRRTQGQTEYAGLVIDRRWEARVPIGFLEFHRDGLLAYKMSIEHQLFTQDSIDLIREEKL